MTALTKERDTRREINSGYDGFGDYPVAAGVKILQGSIVCEDGTGLAVPGATGAGRILGRARQTVDNTSGADGDLRIEVDYGIFFFANDTTNPVPDPAPPFTTGLAAVLDDQTFDDGTGTGPTTGARLISSTAAEVKVLIHPAVDA